MDAVQLRGRSNECETLERLIGAVRGGRSRVLVLRGEAGVGKTALLQYAGERCDGCRVARAIGIQSEMELPYAGLHQLCAPMLDRLERLPGPQRAALGTAFGLSAGPAPDRFLVGLAVLGLLAEAADGQPLICVVDDAQWLDRASAQALAFAARRLLAESVGIILAVRAVSGPHELTGLPELVLKGLKPADARAVLDAELRWPLDERVRDRIVADARGIPLALVELPRGLTAAELAGGYGLPRVGALSSRIEQSFWARLEALPEDSRRLVLLAAAEPVGDPVLVWRAAERLGIDHGAGEPARASGLLEFGAWVRFRHPLVRSAIYRAASLEDRRSVHEALAATTDPVTDPDRRAWHRAHAARGTDEDVARELERSAGRARRRGGIAAAAAFLERAAALTPDPARRNRRELDAAQAKQQAGAFDEALGLLASVDAGPHDELRLARVDLARAQIAFAVRRGADAPPLLLRAARRLEPLDASLARDTYLDACLAIVFADRSSGDSAHELAQAARGRAQPGYAPDLLLQAFVELVSDGHAAAAEAVDRAVAAFRSERLGSEIGMRWLLLASHAALLRWDYENWHALCSRQLELARETGLLSMLPMALTARIAVHLLAGELEPATTILQEVEALAEATGIRLPPYGGFTLAALQGREQDTLELAETAFEDLIPRGEGMGITLAQWAIAVLYNGQGRHADALAAASEATANPQPLGLVGWALVELVEAAARTGDTDTATAALDRLTQSTRPSGSDWGLGVEARSRALLSRGETAEQLYSEAIERLGRAGLRSDLARAHLLYGEWLRGEHRRLDAREHLRVAHERFAAMGLGAFAERAARELQATGETARRRTVVRSRDLTPQEEQIARHARDGLSNAEIGARLFISPRTVEYHLHKVFNKLEISARTELADVLS